MFTLDHASLTYGFATHIIPHTAMHGLVPLHRMPSVGDVVLTEVMTTGRPGVIEDRHGIPTNIFPGDQIVTVFSNHHAPVVQYVPARAFTPCDLLSRGGVCGASSLTYTTTQVPTRLRLLGAICHSDGQPLNQRQFGLQPCRVAGGGDVIAVIDAAVTSGKTTTVGTLVRVLSQAGWRVGVARLTGIATSNERHFYVRCGARPVLDFTDAGYPATTMLRLRELLHITDTLVSHLRASGADYIVIELADGIFQRETRLLLDHPDFRASIDHVIFAAGDSLAAAYGARYCQQRGLPLRAISGALTRNPQMMREAEERTRVPCLNMAEVIERELFLGVSGIADSTKTMRSMRLQAA